MSDEAIAASAVVTDTSVPATPAAPAAIAAPPTSEAGADPAWLAKRLERARLSVLAEMGVENVDNAKAALADLKKRRESEMSETERLVARNAELEASAKVADEYRAAVTERAAAALAGLTPEQREFVEESANGDPLRTLRLADKARAAFQVTAAPAAKPVPAPASTSAASPGPTPASAQSANHLATWESLKASNPVLAAHYLSAHTVEISEARKARS